MHCGHNSPDTLQYSPSSRLRGDSAQAFVVSHHALARCTGTVLMLLPLDAIMGYSYKLHDSPDVFSIHVPLKLYSMSWTSHKEQLTLVGAEL